MDAGHCVVVLTRAGIGSNRGLFALMMFGGQDATRTRSFPGLAQPVTMMNVFTFADLPEPNRYNTGIDLWHPGMPRNAVQWSACSVGFRSTPSTQRCQHHPAPSTARALPLVLPNSGSSLGTVVPSASRQCRDGHQRAPSRRYWPELPPNCQSGFVTINHDTRLVTAGTTQ